MAFMVSKKVHAFALTSQSVNKIQIFYQKGNSKLLCFKKQRQRSLWAVGNCSSRKRKMSNKINDMKPSAAASRVDDLVKFNQVVVFSNTTSPLSKKVKALLDELSINYESLEMDELDAGEAEAIKQVLEHKSGQGTFPSVFINGKHMGGFDDIYTLHQKVGLKSVVHSKEVAGTSSDTNADVYDLIVIGGGSGGLAASKEAAKLGMKVAVFDFVKPTPIGTTWGLGGTCVNVGCIPKKLMHQAALLGTAINDATYFGWKNIPSKPSHDWTKMVPAIQDYIRSINWGYRVALKDSRVTYLNEFAEFISDQAVSATDKKGKSHKVKAKDFIIAVGGRPNYPDIPGAKEFGITSDDLFSLPYNPGVTLIIGASYIALECAGFLAGLGVEVTVMVRSILLRGFDQQMAEMIGSHMAEHGVKFLKGWVPTKVSKTKDGSPPMLLVNAKQSEGSTVMKMNVNTIIFATGRDPCTKSLHLDRAGVKLSPKTGRIITSDADATSANNIYAIGDVVEDRPQLTPSAIKAGILLARRLYGNSKLLADYVNVPTTVFTPLEYGCIGLAEEEAIAKYGAQNVEVYHTYFQPYEYSLPGRDKNKSYSKLVCVKTENERVVGFHYLGPNAGEVTQGYALGMRLGATKNDFNMLVGIHPTCAETFCMDLEITKSSGVSALKKLCCG